MITVRRVCAAAALCALSAPTAASGLIRGGWSGRAPENSDRVSPSVYFDVLAHFHQINAFGGELGIACGTTDASAKKNTPVTIGLEGGGYRVAAKIVRNSFHFRFRSNGGTFTGTGHFSGRSAAGTIRYTKGSRSSPATYCTSGTVHWTAHPGYRNY